MINRYWVYDKDDSKTGFPLGELLSLTVNFLRQKVLKVSIHRAEGYGDKVSSWDEQLYDVDDIVLSTLDEVQALLKDDDEILYWLDIEFELANGESFRFGLHDSSSMYVDSTIELGDFLKSKFDLVKG